VPEIVAEDSRFEDFTIKDEKAVSRIAPADYAGKLLVLNEKCTTERIA
jgi:hypothetical protein